MRPISGEPIVLGRLVPGDVGIYRRLTTGLGMEFDKGIERLVDEAVLSWSGCTKRAVRRATSPD